LIFTDTLQREDGELSQPKFKHEPPCASASINSRADRELKEGSSSQSVLGRQGKKSCSLLKGKADEGKEANGVERESRRGWTREGGGLRGGGRRVPETYLLRSIYEKTKTSRSSTEHRGPLLN